MFRSTTGNSPNLPHQCSQTTKQGMVSNLEAPWTGVHPDDVGRGHRGSTSVAHAIVSSRKLLISQLFAEFVLQFPLRERFTTSASTTLSPFRERPSKPSVLLVRYEEELFRLPSCGKDVHNVHEVHGGISRHSPIIFVLCWLSKTS